MINDNRSMRQIFAALTLVCLPGLVAAQDTKPDGPSLMEQGAQMFMDGLMEEMAPAMEGMSDLGEKIGPALRSFTEEMGPAFADLLDQVEDWSVYEAPEKLPNGDIIIRRKPDTEPEKKEQPPAIILDETPQIDL